MKKVSFFALALLGVSFSQVSAGGGEMSMPYDYEYTNPLTTITEMVKENKIQQILSKNILTIMGNNITEDWEYNSKHFYTKKITLNVGIPEELIVKIKSAYIGFTIQDAMMYDMSSSISKTEVTSGKNYIKMDIDVNNIPADITFKREVFDEYITDNYGASFVGTIFLELTDGTTIPFSNEYYLYVNGNTQEGKLGHLSNMYYSSYPYAGSPDLETLLKKYFEKLETKMGSVAKYIEALGRISEKVESMTKKYEEAQTQLTKDISSEEDFTTQLEMYGKVMQRYNILSDLKWRIGTEIQTRNSEGVLDELFGEE